MIVPAADVVALTVQIKEAFQDVLRGEGISLSETEVLDDYGGAEARQEARSWDTDTHWWEVSDEDLLAGRYFTHLDDLGWRYYLPAFMTHSLKVFSEPRTGIAVTRRRTLEMLINYGEREKQKWAILTPEQSRTVCLYLRFVAAHGDESSAVRRAEKGLRQHWGQFCGG